MTRRPPRSTRTDTLFPYTTLFRAAFAAVRAEVDEVVGDRAPTIDDLRAMPLTLGAVNEVLRMWPPGPAAPRMSIAPSEVHGMEIPAGRLRSEERRVGQECVSTCRSRWSPYNSKKNKKHSNRHRNQT